MMRIQFFFYLLLGIYLCGVAQKPLVATDTKEQISDQTKALLVDWYPRILDHENGGYLTNFSHDWTLESDQPKMIVSQARGLWTAARGYAFNRDPKLLAAAQHGFEFLTNEMWDPIHGGFFQYWEDRRDGQNGVKMAYGNAFAIYALAQYAKVLEENEEVLAWCQKALDWLDKAAHDDQLGGYFNLISREGHSANAVSFDPSRLPNNSWGNPDWKDQNSSIHLMEAFTTLYEVMPNDTTFQRLEEMLTLVRDVMVGPRKHLHLFFERNWSPIDHSAQGRDHIMNHIGHDHVSFGHDIETAYLLIDASEKLYGQCDDLTLKVAKDLCDHSLDHGFDKDFYGILDKGYYFLGKDNLEVVDSNKVWWSQAEAWHACILFANHFPKETRYRQAANSMWRYIDEQLIDHEKGGWYSAGLDVNAENRFSRKAQQWKSCYHDGRALMQVSEYLR